MSRRRGTHYALPALKNPGLPIKIHRSSGRARKTTMWLKDTDTLVWFTKRTVGGKRWHKLSLRGVTSVNVRDEGVRVLS